MNSHPNVIKCSINFSGLMCNQRDEQSGCTIISEHTHTTDHPIGVHKFEHLGMEAIDKPKTMKLLSIPTNIILQIMLLWATAV